LGALFGKGIVDPPALEQDGAAYIADCDLDRNDEVESGEPDRLC